MSLGPLRFVFRFLLPPLAGGMVTVCPAESDPAEYSVAARVEKVPAGPWGNLEYFTLVLEPPPDYLGQSPSWDAHLRPVQWIFPSSPAAAIRPHLLAAGFSENEADDLLAKSSIHEATGEVTIFPAEAQVLSLKPEARERLYGGLATGNRDDPYSYPFSFTQAGFRAAAADSGLPAEVVDLVESLSYQRFEARLFSDVGTVMRRMPDEAGRRVLLSTLHRTLSLAPRLRIDAASDLGAIARYWSAFGRSKDVLSILESVSQNQEAPAIDLVHLLPATPRKLLHTYPRALMSLGPKFPDCHWTAFNFFSAEPSDHYLDSTKVNDWLADQYDRIEALGEVGDLILYVDLATGEPVHACNFVAGNIVYTKNGLSLMKPWVLQTIDEVDRIYITHAGIEVRYFRKRRLT